MNSDCATRMQLALRFKVDGMGKLRCGVDSEVVVFAANHDSGRPFLTGATRAKQPAFVVAHRLALILRVLAERYFAQILNAVVIAYTIDVIKVPHRPFAGYIKPCESMCLV